jgi:hypothetical protein
MEETFMNSAIFMVTLAVAGTFFTGLASFLIVPLSASRRPEYSGSRQDERSTGSFYPATDLSKEKRLFGDVLERAVGKEAVVFTQVPVANVLARAEGRRRWSDAFNRISGMYFDFVVCAADGSATKFAIQLEDSSQRSRKQLKRDQLLTAACESAALPLVRIRAARGYAIGNIRERLAESLAAAETTR